MASGSAGRGLRSTAGRRTRVKVFIGQAEQSLEVAEQNLALAEQLGDDGLVAQALSGIAGVFGQPAHGAAEVRVYLDRAIGLALQTHNWRVLPLLYVQRATNRLLTGDLDGDIEDRRRAIDAADRSGQTERLAFAYRSLAGLIWTGRWAEWRDAVRIGLELESDQEHAYNAHARGMLALMEGRPDDAATHFEQFIVTSRKRRDLQGVTLGLLHLIMLRLQLDRVAQAEAPARELLDVMRRWGGLVGYAAGPLAEAFVRNGTEDAERVLVELELLVDETGEVMARPQLLRARALLLTRRDAVGAALEALESSATLARSQHAVVELAQTLAVYASLARKQGDDDAARRADAERLTIVESIGPEARVFALARGLPRASREQAGSDGPLSPREREVAALIVGGLSNRQIAASLVISERTVENHVSSILARLGVDTRAQVAVWAAQHGLAAEITAR